MAVNRGMDVRVRGLQQDRELNGTVCRVTNICTTRQGFPAVQLSVGGQERLLRLTNVEPVGLDAKSTQRWVDFHDKVHADVEKHGKPFVGAPVQAHGLTSQAELNGLSGYVMRFEKRKDGGDGAIVWFDDDESGRQFLLPFSNLELLCGDACLSTQKGEKGLEAMDDDEVTDVGSSVSQIAAAAAAADLRRKEQEQLERQRQLKQQEEELRKKEAQMEERLQREAQRREREQARREAELEKQQRELAARQKELDSRAAAGRLKSDEEQKARRDAAAKERLQIVKAELRHAERDESLFRGGVAEEEADSRKALSSRHTDERGLAATAAKLRVESEALRREAERQETKDAVRVRELERQKEELVQEAQVKRVAVEGQRKRRVQELEEQHKDYERELEQQKRELEGEKNRLARELELQKEEQKAQLAQELEQQKKELEELRKREKAIAEELQKQKVKDSSQQRQLEEARKQREAELSKELESKAQETERLQKQLQAKEKEVQRAKAEAERKETEKRLAEEAAAAIKSRAAREPKKKLQSAAFTAVGAAPDTRSQSPASDVGSTAREAEPAVHDLDSTVRELTTTVRSESCFDDVAHRVEIETWKEHALFGDFRMFFSSEEGFRKRVLDDSKMEFTAIRNLRDAEARRRGALEQLETGSRKEVGGDEKAGWRAITTFWVEQAKELLAKTKELVSKEEKERRLTIGEERSGFEVIAKRRIREATQRLLMEEEESSGRATIFRHQCTMFDSIYEYRHRQAKQRAQLCDAESVARGGCERDHGKAWEEIRKVKAAAWTQETKRRRADRESSWRPDSEAAACEACKAEFSLLRRRHHCRDCGGIFCNTCSSQKVALPDLGYEAPVRVCNSCAKISAAWHPDDGPEARSCQSCGVRFGLIVRRHHCRACGKLFCKKCASKSLPLLDLGYTNPHRVCDHCYDAETAYAATRESEWAASPKGRAFSVGFSGFDDMSASGSDEGSQRQSELAERAIQVRATRAHARSVADARRSEAASTRSPSPTSAIPDLQPAPSSRRGSKDSRPAQADAAADAAADTVVETIGGHKTVIPAHQVSPDPE